ncbi:MAG: T9SS type A sorting domain-containing protein, partial [Flavobacteriales bacterium]|nr:T9SS type A sorting domain-containing protein [Flavobacteriales bacterium]
ILCSSQLSNNTLEDSEIELLYAYVEAGGVVVAPRVLDSELEGLFGHMDHTQSYNNYQIDWDSMLSEDLTRGMDEPEEWTISLGEMDSGDIFKTYSYDLSTAEPLAFYDNGTVAVSTNAYGSGKAISFGIDWKDAILRSQINRDYEAQRITSNGFEPTQDVFMMMIRSIFIESVPYATWKHTSAKNTTSTLMLTHDVDSKTGMDSLHFFSTSEQEMGITSTYNITLRYFSDALMAPFYIGSEEVLDQIFSDGHTIGSHSVGHFFDFADTDIFPMGSTGNTVSNYNPSNDGTITTGGTVFGECEVSMNVLEADHGQTIRSFRAGHLAYNNFLIDVLDSLGYEYNSSYSASDVLTNFPYQNKKGRSFSGERSNVYELPVTISDVMHDDPITEDNYIEKADLWLDVVSKVDANHGSTVLLIHPNRSYKLLGQEYFLSQLPETIDIQEINDFGDYWRNREAYRHSTALSNDTLLITIPQIDYLTYDDISLVIANGQFLDHIVMEDEFGNELGFAENNWKENDLILFQQDIVSAVDELEFNTSNMRIYPNPAEDHITIEFNLSEPTEYKVEFTDIEGKRIGSRTMNKGNRGLISLNMDIQELKLSPGIYVCHIVIGNKRSVSQKLIVR